MRDSGILMHISSLPSNYGIGTMGKEAYKFVDFLADAKQKYWQILPLCPTSYGDSPYQSFSSYAGNPYFIDLDILIEEKLLTKEEVDAVKWDFGKDEVNYSNIYYYRFDILKKAFERFKKQPDKGFDKFLADNEKWISNYALFMSAKTANCNKAWLSWDLGLRQRDPHALWCFKNDHSDEVMFWEFLQFKFFEQWSRLKSYANKKGIKIIGDIPIYVALDSVDVWVYTDLFDLSATLEPNTVAGCPPDGFSPTGQLWGNPIYNWARHKELGYNWWIDRLKAATSMYDVVRIDHFRGFDEYYAVPYGDKTAENGEWKKGPGKEFFRIIKEKMGTLPIIAEDLGFLTDSVVDMLKESGFPGMKVLEFAFDPREKSNYLPYNYTSHSVVYIGTHDNNTILGWIDELDKESLDFCTDFIGAKKDDKKDIVWKMIRCAFSSVSDIAIIQMQDYLELGKEARMNTPATSGGNWKWRMSKSALSNELAKKIADITVLYGR